MGSKVGFIYGMAPLQPLWVFYALRHFVSGGMCFLACVCGYLFLPELKGRSLEEVEVMFQAGLPLRKFNQYRGEDGVGAAISRLERLESDDDVLKAKARVLETERTKSDDGQGPS